MDCGLNLGNCRDSLENTPGRTGTHGSDPLDPDPAAEDVMIRDLILAVGNRSDGSGAMGARGGGEARRNSLFRGGA